MMLLFLLFGFSRSLHLDLEPPSGLLVRETENATFTFIVKGNAISARFEVSDPSIVRLETGGVDLEDGANHSVLVTGLFVGKTDIRIIVRTENGSEETFWYPVGALRSELGGVLTTVFVVVAIGVSFLNDTLMGIQLDRHSIWAMLKKPISPALGLFCQWVLMAPLAAGWAMLLLSDAAQQFSLFLVGLMPAWVYSLGRVFTSRLGLGGASIRIPFQDMGTSLALAAAPAFIGLAIRHFRPGWQPLTRKIVKWLSFLLLIVILPVVIFVNWYIFAYFTWRTVLAGFCLPASGFALGLGTGYAARRGYPAAIAMAVGTAIQNVQIAMFVLRFALPEPERDLVLVVPTCFIIFSALPIWLLLLARMVYNCVTGKTKEDVAVTPKEDDDPSPLKIIVTKLLSLRATRKVVPEATPNTSQSHLTEHVESGKDGQEMKVASNAKSTQEISSK